MTDTTPDRALLAQLVNDCFVDELRFERFDESTLDELGIDSLDLTSIIYVIEDEVRCRFVPDVPRHVLSDAMNEIRMLHGGNMGLLTPCEIVDFVHHLLLTMGE